MNTNMEKVNSIGDNIFEAISIIATDILEKAPIDKTVECIVIDDSKQKENTYTVMEGTASFTASAISGVICKKFDKVLVRIPEGNYGKQKVITGIVSNEEDDRRVNYVDPFDNFIPIFDNLIKDFKQKDIIINGEVERIECYTPAISAAQISSAKNTKNENIFNTISIEATFQTMLSDCVSGHYGILLELVFKNTDRKYYVGLDSTEFFGNPYDFMLPSIQRKTAKLNNIEELKEIKTYLYHNKGEFKDSNGKLLDGKLSRVKLLDLKVGFGTDISKIEDNTVELYTTNTLSYKNSEDSLENIKNIGINWYNKDVKSNKYIGFSDGVFDPNYDELEYIAAKASHDYLIAEKTEGRYWSEDALRIAAYLAEIKDKWLKKIFELLDDNTLFASGLVNLSREPFKAIYIADSFNNDKSITVNDYITRLQSSNNNLNGSFAFYQDAVNDLYQNYYDITNDKLLKNPVGILDGEIPWSIVFKDYLFIIEQYFTNTKKSQTDFYYCSYAVKEKLQQKYNGYVAEYETLNKRMYDIYKEIEGYINKIQSLMNSISNLLENNYKTTEEYSSVFEDSQYTNRYCIYWYRQNLGYSDTNNTLMGTDWEPLPNWKNFGLPKAGKTIEDKGYLEAFLPLDQSKKSYALDYKLPEEKLAAIIFYNHEQFKTSPLVFTREAIDGFIAMDNSGILKIEHGKNSKLNYSNYIQNNQIAKKSEAALKRELMPSFSSSLGHSLKDFIGGNIYWYFPNQLTMLKYQANSTIISEYQVSTEKHEIPESCYIEGYTCFSKNITVDNYKDNLKFEYFISDYYVPSHSNNKIICRVVKDNWNYLGEIFFSFTSSGNNGSGYSFVLKPVEENSALSPGRNLKLKPLLFDIEGKALDIFSSQSLVNKSGVYGVNFAYSWRKCKLDSVTTPNTTIQTIDGKVNLLELTNSSVSGGQACCGILEATLTIVNQGSKQITLKTYYSVPFNSSNKIYYLDGAIQVSYNSMGQKEHFYDNPYQLYNGNELIDASWLIEASDKNKEDLPKITTNYHLVPKDNYVLLDDFALVVGYVNGNATWYQPIILTQSSHDFQLLNDWDGKIKISEEEGYILSSTIVAGNKELNDSEEKVFTGVIMGDIGKADGTVTGSGLLGLHEGISSFGFKTDGTAFIGKSGKGRIEFNGNEALIKSSDENGMSINLATGQIVSKNFELRTYDDEEIKEPEDEAKRFLISSNPPQIWIGNLLKAKQDEVYLRTSDFVEQTYKEQDGKEVVDESGIGMEIRLTPLMEGEEVIVPAGIRAFSGFRLESKGLLISSAQDDQTSGEIYLENLFKVSTDEFYLRTKDFAEPTDKDIGSGMEIRLTPLMEGEKVVVPAGIRAYQNFALEAYKGDEFIKIDSSNNDFPLQINDRFKVKWNGDTEVSSLKVYSADDTQDGITIFNNKEMPSNIGRIVYRFKDYHGYSDLGYIVVEGNFAATGLFVAPDGLTTNKLIAIGFDDSKYISAQDKVYFEKGLAVYSISGIENNAGQAEIRFLDQVRADSGLTVGSISGIEDSDGQVEIEFLNDVRADTIYVTNAYITNIKWNVNVAADKHLYQRLANGNITQYITQSWFETTGKDWLQNEEKTDLATRTWVTNNCATQQWVTDQKYSVQGHTHNQYSLSGHTHSALYSGNNSINFNKLSTLLTDVENLKSRVSNLEK